MSDFFIGEIRMFAFDWPPVDWALCDGSIMNSQQNAGLASLLGGMYGGDFPATFALPDLRGRAPMHRNVGSPKGIVDHYPQGEAGGAQAVWLTTSQIPEHTHLLRTDDNPATSAAVAGGLLARSPVGRPMYASATGASPTTLHPDTIRWEGAAKEHNNMQPFAVVNFCISLRGAWPPRP